MGKKLYSFDIFDTLITRQVILPTGIFAIMQKKLQEPKYADIPIYIRENFYTLRIHSEELARYHWMKQGREEITLDDIYEAMSMSGELADKHKRMLYNLEIETEIDNILPITHNIELLKHMIALGKRVILVSDMYLPKTVIIDMLVGVGISFIDNNKIYISSELGCRKTTGNIYRTIKELESVQFKDWMHYGDNIEQDVKIPKLLGISCKCIASCYVEEIEKHILKGRMCDANVQLLLGQSSISRVYSQNTSIPYRIGTTVTGPIIYTYVSWLINKSIEYGYKKLYFIARDGYLLKKVADRIIEIKNLAIETKYIYGSRKAWRLASLTEEKFNLREFVAWSYFYKIKTTKDLAIMLQLTVEELCPYLPYNARYAEAYIGQESLYIIIDKLEKSKAFKDFFLDKLKATRDSAIAYLMQELNLDNTQFAFVDVSGGGFTQRCLYQLLNDNYKGKLNTFFFKLDRIVKTDSCVYHVFLPSMIPNNLVLEMICHAPHGQTLGYELDSSSNYMKPILDNFEDSEIRKHGFFDMEHGLIDYVDNMLKLEMKKGCAFWNLEYIKECLLYVSRYPDNEILEYFASYPNNESGQAEELTEYAPKLTKQDIENIFIKRMPWELVVDYYKGTNLEYSILRCNKKEKAYIEKLKKSYNKELGLSFRKEKIEIHNRRLESFKRASYYPCELLENKIVLYGAGKFGCELYERLSNESRIEVVGWIDKMLKHDKDLYPVGVLGIDRIRHIKYDQIVIGVVSEQIACEIRQELLAIGVEESKIFWHRPLYSPIGWFEWECRLD